MKFYTDFYNFYKVNNEDFSRKVNSYSNSQQNSKEKLIQKKIIEFIKETENNQEDIFSKLETDYSEFYTWEDYGFVTEELHETYSTNEEYGTVYPPDLQGKLLSKEAQKTISKASKNMQELVFDEDLSPSELRRRALLKLLYDPSFLKSLGLDLNSKVKTILEKINEKINQGVDEKNRRKINTDLNELTDADVMDIARMKFDWLKWDDDSGNVAYLIFKIKRENSIQTGIMFANSKAMEMLGVKNKFGNFNPKENYYRNSLLEQREDIYEILELEKEGGPIWRGWDSESKMLAALLYKYILGQDDIIEFELTVASEKGFCSTCDPSIKNLIAYLHNERNIQNVILRLRNTKGADGGGVRQLPQQYSFLNPYDFYKIKILLN